MNKKSFIKNSLMVVAIALTLSSCDKEEIFPPSLSSDSSVVLLSSNLCPEILNYITVHFPNNSILKAEKEIENNIVTFEVELSGDIDLEFNSNCKIIDIDAEKSALPNSVIPQDLLNYVSLNYPNNFITDWELELNHQEIELNNGINLEFQKDGIFIRVDPD